MPHESIGTWAWWPKLTTFNGPIFHDANLGSTLPLEIPTVYSLSILWSLLRLSVSFIPKWNSRGFSIAEKDFWGKLWQSFAHNLPNGPLNVVWLYVVPSKCLNRALNGSSFWCKEQPIVWRFLFTFFSKSVTSPPSQPVFAFVLSIRTALIVYQLHQYQEEPCESNIYSHLVSPL